MYVYPALQLQTPTRLLELFLGVISLHLLRGNLEQSWINHFGMEIFHGFSTSFSGGNSTWEPQRQHLKVRAPVHLGAVFKNMGECPSRSGRGYDGYV